MNEAAAPNLILAGALLLATLYAAFGWALAGARLETQSRLHHNTARLASTALMMTTVPLPAAAAGTLIPTPAAALLALIYLATATLAVILARRRWARICRRLATWTNGKEDQPEETPP